MIKIEDLKDVKALSEIEGLEIRTYVSIIEKHAMINGIVDMLVEQDKNGIYTVNSIHKEIAEKCAVVSLYTNIELTDSDYDNYDMIMQNGLYAQIDAFIQDKIDGYMTDVDEFCNLLNSRIQDKLEANSLNNVMAVRTQEAMQIFDRTMSHLDGMLDKGDPNMIAKYLSKGVEAIALKLPDLQQLAEKFISKKLG